jgi:hypothetical protein
LPSWPSKSRPIVLATLIMRPERLSIVPMPTSRVWRWRTGRRAGPEANGPHAGHPAGSGMGSAVASRDGAGRWVCLERPPMF